MRIIHEALTFDDVLLQPAYSEILPREVDLATSLTRDITLNIPIVSAAMDTVTESRLAITLAQEGGIGIIHKSMSIEEQAREVGRVKKYESGIISSPITVTPDTSIRDVIELTQAHSISGVPVVEGSELVGIVTHRDLRFETQFDAPVSTVMTPKDRLVTVKEGADEEEVLTLLHRYRIEKVLVVDDNFELRGMITAKDFQKATDFPLACKDALGALRVGAAVGTGADTPDRVEALLAAGVDVVVVDTAHGHTRGALDRIKEIKTRHPDLQLIAGNIVTKEAALALVEAGADGVKVGIGPGSICTTRVVAGVGVPQITAVADVASALAGSDVPLIADGGIRYSGDIAKAIVAGAYCTMIGSLFAGTEESPGEVELYQGRSAQLEKLGPEGIEGRVPYKGNLVAIVQQLIGGVRAAMGYTGSHNIAEMRTRPNFIRITGAGRRESHVHDVTITKEAPNYRAE
jgi:IMP dehydrogenase